MEFNKIRKLDEKNIVIENEKIKYSHPPNDKTKINNGESYILFITNTNIKNVQVSDLYYSREVGNVVNSIPPKYKGVFFAQNFGNNEIIFEKNAELTNKCPEELANKLRIEYDENENSEYEKKTNDILKDVEEKRNAEEEKERELKNKKAIDEWWIKLQQDKENLQREREQEQEENRQRELKRIDSMIDELEKKLEYYNEWWIKYQLLQGKENVKTKKNNNQT